MTTKQKNKNKSTLPPQEDAQDSMRLTQYGVIFVALFLYFAFTIANSNAQNPQRNNALLELPAFEPQIEKSHSPRPVQLQLLTRDELRNLYSDTQAQDTSARAISNQATTSSASPPVSTPDPEPPITHNTPQEQAVASPSATSSSIIQERSTTDALASGWEGGSIMFNDADLLDLQIALAKYHRNRQTQLDDGGITTTRINQKQIYPVIFVGTIMYLSPKNWAVWINGRKFSSKKRSALSGISVIRITKNYVVLNWRTKNSFYNEIDAKNIKKISSKLFEIKMRSNQILMTNDLTIDEGKQYSSKIYRAINSAQESSKVKKEVTLEDLDIDPNQPVDRDKLNMNRLIDQYRTVTPSQDSLQ